MEDLDIFFASKNEAGSQPTLLSFLDFTRNKPDEFWLWCLTEGLEADPRLRELLPTPIEASVQEQYTGQSGKATFEEALGFKKICQDQLRKLDRILKPQDHVLDFGCGWGRISVTFLNRVHRDNLHAVDVNQEVVDVFRGSGFPVTVQPIQPAPPLFFADDAFDLIVSYSVFSHLSEEYFLKWAREFHRLLKPGGVACLTTRPREAIQWFKDLRESDEIPFFAQGAAQSFTDSDAAFRDYDAGRFCFAPEAVPHIGDYFGEACIPLPFVKKHLLGLFEHVSMVLFTEHYLFNQNLIVLKK